MVSFHLKLFDIHMIPIKDVRLVQNVYSESPMSLIMYNKLFVANTV